MPDDLLLAETQQALRRLGIGARKKLGQHFLIDEAVLKRIVTAAALTPGDTIIEVGPGLGILTGELAARAGRVFAVELDDRMAEALKEKMTAYDNVTVVNKNILEVNPASLVGDAAYRVVANLPYYITAPVLRHFLEAERKPQQILVMVQKEVAETIAAKPGKRRLLSVSVQYYGRPEIIDFVPARSFYPIPAVDSALLKIDIPPQPPVKVDDEAGFFRLVRAGFSASRKQLANSLAHGLGIPKTDALTLLEQAGIDPQRRAETLTIAEWARLWGIFTGTGNGG